MSNEKKETVNTVKPDKPSDLDGLRYNLIVLGIVTVIAIGFLTFVLILLNK